MPITYAEGPAAIEEERRLLYVGMTRARVHLAISWALARNPGGRASRKPSRFLDPTGTGPVAGAPSGSRRSRNRKVANCRECGSPLETPAERKTGRCADCPASYDEELFERLRAWRRERAGEDEVPAYVVFTDATLQLIAEHQPRTEEALLKISGIGRGKVDRYAAAVLEIIG
ncbi:HRDC domain-containing protein, partial [Nocardioides sp.]|uniref:HRDC domain-containing protein n=1 Tax=Nocardioides sp. TaxID=35761 RepID=UPI002735D340